MDLFLHNSQMGTTNTISNECSIVETLTELGALPVPIDNPVADIEEGKNDVSNEVVATAPQDDFELVSVPTLSSGFGPDPLPINREELSFKGANPTEVSPFRQDWTPDAFQFSLGTRLLYTDNMAGFYQGELEVTGFEPGEYEGTHILTAGNMSSARGIGAPISFEGGFIRKTPLFRIDGVDENDQPIVRNQVGGFQSKGPSFYVKGTYQPYQFYDHSLELELDDRQLSGIMDQLGYDVANEFDTDLPFPDGLDYDELASFYGDMQGWLNSNEAAVRSLPELVKEAFSGYDPTEDVDADVRQSDPYTVHTLKLDTQFCVENSVWRYDRRFNVLNSGRACLEGSAMGFVGGDDFESRMYLGAGPYLEWSLLTYHQKPFRKPAYYGVDRNREFIPPSTSVSTFVYAELEYFNGFSFDDGFSPYDRFVTANLGIGLRTTVPSLQRRRKPEARRGSSQIVSEVKDRIEEFSENPVDFSDLSDQTFMSIED